MIDKLKKIIRCNKGMVDAGTVIMIAILMVTIVVSVVIFYNVGESVDHTTSTKTFTYTQTQLSENLTITNAATDEALTTTHYPVNDSRLTVALFNNTSKGWKSITIVAANVTISDKTVTIINNSYTMNGNSTFTAANVTYYYLGDQTYTVTERYDDSTVTATAYNKSGTSWHTVGSTHVSTSGYVVTIAEAYFANNFNWTQGNASYYTEQAKETSKTMTKASDTFNLMNVIPIVIVAGIIIAVLIGYFVMNRP